jgi:hypothetical protein
VLIRRGVVYKKQNKMQTLFSFYFVDLISILSKKINWREIEQMKKHRKVRRGNAKTQIQKKPLIS